MAIFHLTAKVISRGKGQSAIAAAAYRSGERLFDEQAGLQKLYRSREERIAFTDIMAPSDAPEWVHDRNALWNAAERAEKRKDAQLAREIEIALPHELTDQQREWLVKDFVREAFVRKGYAVDIAIHAPDQDRDKRNHHAHLMVTRRTIGPDGFAATKDWQFDKTQLEGWREQWEHLANRHLERHGHEARIDRRSLKEQGIDREPTVHVGYAANEMTARGVPSDRMTALNEILARNEIRIDLKALEAEIRTLEQEEVRQRRAAEKERVQQAAAQAEAAQHRALELASKARKRQQGIAQIEKARGQQAAEQKQHPAAQEAKPNEVAVRADKPAQPQQEAAPTPERQQRSTEENAITQIPPTPRKAETVRAPEKAKSDQREAPQQWGYSTSIVQTSQGYVVPVVPIEHIAVSQQAAERARAHERGAAPQAVKANPSLAVEAQAIRAQVRSDQRIDAQAARAAAQEEARQRYVENYPYDRSRTRLSTGQQKQQEAWQAKVAAQNPDRIGPREIAARAVRADRQIAHGSLRVMNKTTGVVSSLGNFLSNLLSSSTPPPEQPNRISMRTLVTDPNARKEYQLAQHAEAKRRGMAVEALDNIQRDIAAGRDLSAADVSKLPRTAQEQILAKGDSYVRELIESSRKRADEYWRGRERERD